MSKFWAHARRFSTMGADRWYFEKNAVNANQRDLAILSMVVRATILCSASSATAATIKGIYEESLTKPKRYTYHLAANKCVEGAANGAKAVLLAPIWVPAIFIGMPVGRLYAWCYADQNARKS